MIIIIIMSWRIDVNTRSHMHDEQKVLKRAQPEGSGAPLSSQQEPKEWSGSETDVRRERRWRGGEEERWRGGEVERRRGGEVERRRDEGVKGFFFFFFG